MLRSFPRDWPGRHIVMGRPQPAVRHDGKEKTASFGPYPEVSLSAARAKRDEGRATLRSAVDPMAVRKQEREQRLEAAATTFGAVAAMLVEEKQQGGLAAASLVKQHYFLGQLPPSITTAPIADLRIADVAKPR